MHAGVLVVVCHFHVCTHTESRLPYQINPPTPQVRFAGDKAKAQSVYAGMDPITAEDMAETMYWVATLPAHVCVNSMELMPVQQAFAGFAVSRRGAGKE